MARCDNYEENLLQKIWRKQTERNKQTFVYYEVNKLIWSLSIKSEHIYNTFVTHISHIFVTIFSTSIMNFAVKIKNLSIKKL